MIELRNLSVGYGSRTILQNIDMEIPDSRVLVLLGPNGCGKSTLLKTILALQPKLSGEIIVNGTALEHLTNRERARQMAYLPQSRTTPNISVRRMVLHGRFPYMSYPRQYGEDDFRAVEQAMELTGTAEYADAMMPQLSGGQQQKVYIAMALAQGTGTILLDEPTTFLDAGSQLDTYRLAKSFAGEGKAVVLVTHDLPLALQYADEIAVLAEGKLCAFGTPETVYGSGVLDRVFGITLKRTETEDGRRYYLI